MGKRRRGPAGVRYDLKVITSRIKHRMEAQGVPVKVMCDVLGIERWDWSRKVNITDSSFNYREISLIADRLDAPVGWPFIDEALSELFEAYLERIKKDPPEE